MSNQSPNQETIDTIKEQASGLIWTLSKTYPNLIHPMTERVNNQTGVSGDMDEMVKTLFYQQCLFNVMEWLSGIACDDWWWPEPAQGVAEIVMEIEQIPMMPILTQLRKSRDESVWKRFCHTVCDAAGVEHQYGRLDFDDLLAPFDFDAYRRLGEYHRLIYTDSRSMFNREECLVPTRNKAQ